MMNQTPPPQKKTTLGTAKNFDKSKAYVHVI